MSTLIWAATAAIILALIAIDVLRDAARQHREDRAWAELEQMLRED